MRAFSFIFSLLLIQLVNSEYVVTFPRRFTADTPTPLCVELTTGTFGPSDTLKATLVDRQRKGPETLIIEETDIPLTEGKQEVCRNIQYPYSELNSYRAELNLKGSIEANEIDAAANVSLTQKSDSMFLNTDKSLYKPGQKVQFRLLTVDGPKLEVSTRPYDEIYVETPSRIRIFQWLNVENTNGLVHLDFTLSDEVDEGSYKIIVKRGNDRKTTYFRVEDYVLPRYELTIKGPDIILGSDPNVTITLCARYTFGQPVNGVASLSVVPGRWRVYTNLTQTKKISGCQDFTYNTSQLLFDQNNCHIRISNLRVFAHVNESGTDETIYADETSLRVSRRAITFRDTSPNTIRKPYLHNRVEIEAKYADGTLAKQEQMEVCSRRNFEEEEVCRNFTTCNSGLLEFALPNDHSNRVKIRATKYPRQEKSWNDVMESSEYNLYPRSYEEYLDKNSSSITIYAENELECVTGEDINVKVPLIYILKGLTQADLYVKVLSRGQIVYSDRSPVTFTPSELPFRKDKSLFPIKDIPKDFVVGTLSLPLVLPSSSSPNIKIIVWLYRRDGSMIADAREVKISPCLNHKVNLNWSVEKGEPGALVTASVGASPNAICSLGVVDKSVELLSSGNNLNVLDVLRVADNSVVQRWDESQLNIEYCLRKRGLTEPSFPNLDKENSESAAEEDDKINLREARSIILPPIEFNYNDKEALHMFVKAGLHVFTNLEVEDKYCDHLFIQALKSKIPSSPGAGIIEQDEVLEIAAAPPALLPEPVAFAQGSAQKQKVPELQATVAEPADSSNERTYFPETWLWDLVTVPANGVLDKKVTLPDTITEWIGRTVCVHTTDGVGISDPSSVISFTPFFVDILLPSSVIRGEVLPLAISVFNYENFPLPINFKLSPSSDFDIISDVTGATGEHKFCIPQNDKYVQYVTIIPKTIGDINITVEAETDTTGGSGCTSEKVPKKLDRVIRSLPVESNGILREKTFSQYVCGQDITDPTSPVSIWNFLPPTGTIEGSARAWVAAIGDLLGNTAENLDGLVRLPTGCGEQNLVRLAPNIFVLEYLEQSRQKVPELEEKLLAFSNEGYQRQLRFRRPDNSYSAFGNNDADGSTWLTAFVVKTFARARKFIYVDGESLEKSVQWLRDRQVKGGCFENRGRVIHKRMQGGLKEEGSLLTAYVASALADYGDDISSALPCINTLTTSTNNYDKALLAYVLSLAKAPGAQAAIDSLLSSGVSNSSMMRWDLESNTNINSALHVETAAYALLALQAFDSKTYSDESRKIVRWLASQRNGQGGFISTQDTVVGLQALTEFEKNSAVSALNLKATMTSNNFNHEFVVLDNNKFLQQTKDLPELSEAQEVSLKVQGEGCGLFQGVMRYNVPGNDNSQVFGLTVASTATATKKRCKEMKMSICANYKLADKASRMALIVVNLISGYEPVKEDLKILREQKLVKRYEINRRKLTFYLDEITSENVCLEFKVQRTIDVKKTKPGVVSVIDYYDPEIENSVDYTFETC